MIRNTPRSPAVLNTLALALALAVPACGGSETAGDGFAEAIPTDAELALTLDDGGSAALTPEDALGQPSRIRALTVEAFERINGMRQRVHQRIEALIDGVEPTVVEEGPLTCKQWETDTEAAHWRLRSCETDHKNKHYAFALKGRALDAGDDALVTIFQGEGQVRAAQGGERRGSGWVRFDFDALAGLAGPNADGAAAPDGPPSGQLGLGFRAVGRVRQLNVLLKDFARSAEQTPLSGLYRYKHIVGVGGRVTLVADGDIAARADDGTLMQGADGLEERVRAIVAWNRGVGARAAAAVCGGTAGEGVCEAIVQCWQGDGQVSHEATPDAEAGNGNGRGNGHAGNMGFSASACPGAKAELGDISDLPSEDETALPGNDAVPEEPAADPSEG